MSKITGNEVVATTFDSDGKVVEWGETLRQRALREFMAALIQRGNMSFETIPKRADEYVTAYINQLNKP